MFNLPISWPDSQKCLECEHSIPLQMIYHEDIVHPAIVCGKDYTSRTFSNSCPHYEEIKELSNEEFNKLADN